MSDPWVDGYDSATKEWKQRALEAETKTNELHEVCNGLMKWALYTVAKGDPESEILPKGWERWQGIVKNAR